MDSRSIRVSSRSFGRSQRGSLKTWVSSFVKVSTNGCDIKRKRAPQRKVRLKAVNNGYTPSWHSPCQEPQARLHPFRMNAAVNTYERSCSQSHPRINEDEAHAARSLQSRQTTPGPGRSHAFCSRRQPHARHHADRSGEVALLPTTDTASTRHDCGRVAADLVNERSGRQARRRRPR